MGRSKWFFHPLAVFIYSLFALGTSLFIYIHSYLKVNDAFRDFVLKHNNTGRKLFDSDTWVMILITSVLVAIIIAGLAIIYIYYHKMIILYRKQQNFINGFTHELKTPITSLNLFIDTFLRHDFPRDKQIKYLKFMQKDTRRLSDNVNQILNLAKIEEKRKLQDLSPLDVYQVIFEFIEKDKEMFGKLQIYFERPKEKIILFINLNLFNMMLMNIFTNAVRYNEKENPSLRVDIKKTDKKIEIFFKDNGIGLVKEELKEVFKKFYQVGASVKGTGLGLYLVSNVVRLHKGKALMMSEGLGKGSTMVLNFKQRSFHG